MQALAPDPVEYTRILLSKAGPERDMYGSWMSATSNFPSEASLDNCMAAALVWHKLIWYTDNRPDRWTECAVGALAIINSGELGLFLACKTWTVWGHRVMVSSVAA